MFALLRQQGLTGGLVKGALSVAASAYKALFTGQGPTQVTHLAAFFLPYSHLCVLEFQAYFPVLKQTSQPRFELFSLHDSDATRRRHSCGATLTLISPMQS